METSERQERNNTDEHAIFLDAVLAEKFVLRIAFETQKVFVVLHKAKVTGATYEEKYIRSRGFPVPGIHFGTLYVSMSQSRQRMAGVSVGIVDMRTMVLQSHPDVLVPWVVRDRIALLTGFFGVGDKTKAFVSELAVRTGAISWTPMYQALKFRGKYLVHPSFWLFFGYYRRIAVPENVTAVADTLCLGLDLWEEFIRLEDMPYRKRNDVGSGFLQNVGSIRMKPIDWNRWFNGCFQTCIWLGTSTPSRSSQAKARAKAKGKPKGKGKGKGAAY